MTVKKVKRVDKVELINLLSCIYKDAQMAIDGKWDPTYDKGGFEAQQELIDDFCTNNKLRIKRK